jgi:hypothetical protein
MKLNKYILLCGLTATTLALTTACDDQSDEITSLEYSRLFSPINLEARVVNQINVRLNWSAVKGASTYSIAVYLSQDQNTEVDEDETTNDINVSGNAIKTITGLTADDIPYTVTGLEGETKYTFVISAQGEGISDSKGTSIEAKTGTEQIMKSVDDADIEAKSVVLRWSSSAVGCTIQLTPGDISHVITAEEDADMAATIDGLTGETEYTAKIISTSGKTRGTTTFKTAVDLGDAIAVQPGADLKSIIENAEEGATLAFFPGTYSLTNDEGGQAKIAINKSISFKAVRPAERPVINACFQLNSGASFTASQIVFDGTGSDGSQTFDFKTATTYAELNIDDCEIKNYTKGVFYINVAAQVNKITFNNCLIHDIECNGGDMFDSRKGAYVVFDFTENTVWNSAKGRDFMRFDNASSSFKGVAPVLNIINNTLVDLESSSDSYRLLYVRFTGTTINFKNNIVSGVTTKRGFSNMSATPEPTFSNNFYYNSEHLSGAPDGTEALFYDKSGTVANPKFADAANGDFTVGDEDVAYKKAGASRWLK